jgi:ubiquinone/menaquinone biosynthesis C-methylase UbiE/DNA-binding transcriptional ArsR family regulator
MTEQHRMGLDTLLAGLRAGGDPTRLRLLALLARGDLNVKDLTQILGQSQPRISRHLKLLTEAGLIDRFREGSWVFYRLAESGPASALARGIVALVDPGEAVVGRDLERLAAVKDERAADAAAYFRAQAGDWDRVRALHVDEAEVERAMLEAIGAGPFDRLLDLGTGTGRVLELFAPRIRRGVGVDLSHEMLTFARAKLDKAGYSHCQVRHGDLYALPFEAASFDVVTIHQVLHYLDDPARAIGEAARMLRPGGRLLIVDFAPHDLEFLRQEQAHRRLGFSAADVAKWVAAAGLRLGRHRELGPPKTAAGARLVVSLWLAEAPGKAPHSRPAEARPLEEVQ